MAYGEIKVDTITFTNGGIDKSVSISGLVQNPTFSGNITVTGTISGNIVRGQTVSGNTVTGTTAQFTSGTFTNITGGVATITSGVFASGSAAAPSVSVGTTDNGIYSPGTDQVAISTNGTGRLFVDATGKVTVNQATDGVPSINIESDNDGRICTILRFTDTDVATAANQPLGVIQFFGSDTSGAGAGIKSTIGAYSESANGDSYLTFSTATSALNNQERLRITSAGLVGIGTSSPGSLLSLYAGASSEYFRGGGNGVNTRDLVLSASTGTNAGDTHTINASASTGRLILSTASSPRMTVDSSGRVGIGTTSPGVALHVDGDIRADGIYGETDTNTSIQFPGSDVITFNEGGSEAARIDSSGRLGVGTASPLSVLDVQTNAAERRSIRFSGTGISNAEIHCTESGGYNRSLSIGGQEIGFFTDTGGATTRSERARIDSSGRLLVGTSSARSNFFNTTVATQFQLEGTTAANSSLSVTRNSADADASNIILGKTRSASVGGNTIVNSGDQIGQIGFHGSDGTELVVAATIRGEVDGTPGADDMPGRLVFSTTSDASASPTERLRITSAGVLQVADAGNIAVGTTTGTKIGTATTQKLGFFNKTPVVQPAAVADATDAASVITQLNALLARMRDLGLIAT